MNLTSIRPGDIIRVDDGLSYHAEVTDKRRGELTVRALHGSHSLRTVKAHDVGAHWRKTGRVREQVAA